MSRAVQPLPPRRLAPVAEPSGFLRVRLPSIERARLPALLTLAYLALCAALLPFHEMWRDEIQAWLIARDTDSLVELYAVLRHEGHPGLWHLCLKLLEQLTGSPVAMQAFHVGTAAATVFVFARFSPFSGLQKGLFAFGYFPLYEYALVSRNYALSVLLMFAFCALYERRRERPWSIGIVVFLLANTNVLGLIVSMILLTLLVLERLMADDGGAGAPDPAPHGTRAIRGRGSGGSGGSGGTFAASCLFMLSGVISSFLQILPGPYVAAPTAAIGAADGVVPKALVNAFIPVVGPALRLSGNPESGHWLYLPLALVIGTVLLRYACRIRERAFALAFLVAATLALLLFFQVVFAGQPRHHGFLFVVLLCSLWLAGRTTSRRDEPDVRTSGARDEGRFGAALTFVLLVQSVGGVAAAAADVRHTFSHARSVAGFLRERNLDDEEVVAYPDAPVSAVLGHLPPRAFYYPQIDEHGSFIRWTSRRARTLTAVEVLCAARMLARERERDVLLISNASLDLAGRDAAPLLADTDLELLVEFGGALVPSENYRVHRLARPTERPHASCPTPSGKSATIVGRAAPTP